MFLVHKHADPNTDDDRWLYVPKLDKENRIVGKDKRNRFLGTHYLYEDVSGRSIEEDTHELTDTTGTYYVLKHTPKDPESVEFAYYTTHIFKKNFIVVRTTYYDEKDKPYRRYDALGFKTIQGYPTIVKSRMTDLRTKEYTEAVYGNVRYNVKLPRAVFEKRALRRPPRKFLKYTPPSREDSANK